MTAPGATRLAGDVLLASSHMPDAEIRRLLRAELHQLRRKTGQTQIYVELFSGCGIISKKIRQLGGYGCLDFDLSKGVQYDLTRNVVINMLEGWCKAGIIRGAWVAFPCTTFSQARRPPLRSAACLRGLPEMLAVPRLRAQIQAGDRTLSAALRLAYTFVQHNIVSVFENPHGSLAWQDRRWQRLFANPAVTVHKLDYCQFGTKWRKRTRLVTTHTGVINKLNCLCSGRRGFCSSGQPHVHLKGALPGIGCLTRAAEPYPSRLALTAARAMLQIPEARQIASLCRFCL